MSANAKRIIVIGGGFAGAFAARYLRRRLNADTQVELISNRNYFVFQPLLPEVAAGTINTADAVTPLRLMLKGVRVRMGEVNDVDFDRQVVEVVQGTRRVPIERPYDHLVIAPGQKAALARFPGFAEHGLTMRDLADAHTLRNHMIQCLEHADVTENAQLKARLLTFVIAGGGFSGVEVAGEVHEMISRTLRHYPNIDEHEIKTILVHRGKQILPELPDKLGAYAARKLEKHGVDIRLGTSLKRATATAVYTTDGEMIDTHTIVTTIGSGPVPLVEKLGVPLDRGRITTDASMRVEGFDNVWSLGDAALVPLTGMGEDETRKYAPTTAQFALREARVLARNIDAVMKGQEPGMFDHKPLGTMASIGHYRAVAEVAGLRMSGLFAWLLWRGFYISLVPGFSTRLRVALNWLFDYFLPRSIVQITTADRAAAQTRHCAKGDVLFEPGQIVDGFYAVVDGTLESRVPSKHGEDFVRILGPGDHWGERSLIKGARTRGWLTAADDCELLVMNRHDYVTLRRTFQPFDEYFEKIPEKFYPRAIRDDQG